jgi:hypothetical protein
MRAVTRACFILALCCLCGFGWLASSSSQVPAFPDYGDLVPTDAAPFQSRLNRVAEEYRVQPPASGHVFSSSIRDVFLFRLGEGGEDCSKQKTCIYVMFRDAQDNMPFVTFCAPGLFELSHTHTPSGALLHAFEFVCEKTKFEILLSSHSAFVASYIEMD